MERLLTSVLSAVTFFSLAAGCTPVDQVDDNQTSSTTDAGDEGDYTIATNNLDMGAYPLDIVVADEQSTADTTDMALTVTNNELATNKVITQLQSQLVTNLGGTVFLDISETLSPVVAQYYKNAKTPYIFYVCSPTDEDMERIKQDKYYVDMVIYGPKNEGLRLVELVLADDCKTVVISTGASGDHAHNRRIVGSTETFKAGGGEILFISHSADPSEVVQKVSDYVTAYDGTNYIYATSEDYIILIADVIKSRGITGCKTYGPSISPSVCQLITDGQVEACMGDESVYGSLAVILLISYLDDNSIKNADGTASYFDNLTQLMMIAENAKNFYEFLSDENLATHAISDEEYQSLLACNSPDVGYDHFYDFLTNYEENVYVKVEANAVQ